MSGSIVYRDYESFLWYLLETDHFSTIHGKNLQNLVTEKF